MRKFRGLQNAVRFLQNHGRHREVAFLRNQLGDIIRGKFCREEKSAVVATSRNVRIRSRISGAIYSARFIAPAKPAACANAQVAARVLPRATCEYSALSHTAFGSKGSSSVKFTVALNDSRRRV